MRLSFRFLGALIAVALLAVSVNGDYGPTCFHYTNMAATIWPNFSIVTLPGGTTYRYIHVRPQVPGKPYILFLHGFPSSSYDWRHQIQYFTQQGYGVVVPDLLGYGGTDHPQDVAAYRHKKMAGEVIGILDHEGIQIVLAVGHDWGSAFLSRLANYYPSRFLSYAFLDVPYTPPGHFDLDAINNASFANLGYTTYGYWNFFNQSDAGAILDTHAESFSSIIYAPDPNIWKTQFAPVGALKNWLIFDMMTPQSTYVTAEEMHIHNRIFLETGGFGASLNWYRVQMENLNEADEKELSPESLQIQQPVLLITGDKDPIIIASDSEKVTRQYAQNLTVRHTDAGHWIQLQARDQANTYLEEFFTQVLEAS